MGSFSCCSASFAHKPKSRGNNKNKGRLTLQHIFFSLSSFEISGQGISKERILFTYPTHSLVITLQLQLVITLSKTDQFHSLNHLRCSLYTILNLLSSLHPGLYSFNTSLLLVGRLGRITNLILKIIEIL